MKFNLYHKLMVILIFIAIGFSIYYPVSNYDILPDKIPTHFNFLGEPDSWSNKNRINLLLGPIIISFTLLFMLPVTWWMARTSDPRKIINLPKEKLAKISSEKAEEVRVTTVFHMLVIMLLTAVLIMVISIEAVLVAIGEQETLGLTVPIIIFLIIGDVAFLTRKVIKLVYK